MRRWRGTVFVGLLAGWLAGAVSARAENWPGWRGPRGDGTSWEEDAPTRWDGGAGEKILWKASVPGKGHASPIVWGDRVFAVSCVEERLERLLLCFDAADGRLLWRRTVIRSPLETKNRLNSYASSTPATDGRRVYVTFLEAGDRTVPALHVSKPRPVTLGRLVVAAYDFSGEQAWLVRPGQFASIHGFCSSPVLHQNLVIVNGDHDGDSYIVALDKATGATVWKTPREHKTRSYSTPLIRRIGGRTVMVLSGSQHIAGFDPATGERLWKVEGPTEQFVASMVDNGEFFFATGGYPTYHVMAIRPGGRGDVTETHVAWHVTDARSYVPSPVIAGPYLLVADDRGTANCFEAATGERLWQARLGKHYSASLTSAGGLVYFLADDGVMKLVRPGPRLDVVAVNELGEYCYASPAFSGGRLFLRGERNLYCIGPGEPSSRRLLQSRP